MKTIADQITICGKTLKNRIVFLPCVTFSFHGDGDDYFGSQHIEHYTQIAEGGAGIVFVQGTNAIGAASGTDQWTKGSCQTLKKIVDVIHANGALAFIQFSWGGDTKTDINVLSTAEIEQKQNELLQAALISGDLGFDGVEFHFGHTLLMCKLLDAETNHRSDRFGDGIEGRARILTEIIPEIKAKHGDDLILSVRMGAYLPDLETGLETARYLEKSGINLLNITFTMVQPEPAPGDFPLSDMAYAGWLVKQAVGIPVIGVGMITTQEKAETLIENEYADLAGVARGVLADPAFPGKILASKPVYECAGCKQCMWRIDHTKCPARLKAYAK